MNIDFTQVITLSVADQLAKEVTERAWRNTELARADIQLNKVEDGVKGIGTVAAWRKYRMALRDWPASDSFPHTAPTAPDAGA